MNVLALGPWLLGALAVPALVCAFVAALALRGTRPEQRPDILRALADLARALLSRNQEGRANSMSKRLRP
jgi:hypothetical protein